MVSVVINGPYRPCPPGSAKGEVKIALKTISLENKEAIEYGIRPKCGTLETKAAIIFKRRINLASSFLHL